jgi:hypothetical protein
MENGTSVSRVEKAMKGLQRNGINSNTNERKDIVLFYLKAIGEFDAAVREWEAKPAADKTWANINTFISAEYAKENKQNKLTAKQFKTNAIDEQAESNRRTHCGLDGSTHQADGDPNQEYNRHHERNDDTAYRKQKHKQLDQTHGRREEEEKGREAKEIQLRTNLQTLWEEASDQTQRQLLGA